MNMCAVDRRAANRRTANACRIQSPMNCKLIIVKHRKCCDDSEVEFKKYKMAMKASRSQLGLYI
jgi:hypothetical protein